MPKSGTPGYLEAFGFEPDGECKIGTWAVVLLPYIEQEPLYDAWQDSSTTVAWNRAGGLTAANSEFYPDIALLRCSLDKAPTEKLGPNSYVCNAGFFPDALPPSYTGMTPQEIARRSTDPTNGVFSNQLPTPVWSCYTGGFPMAVLGSRASEPTRSSDIRDGLTQTIAFSENLQADSWGYVGRPGSWTTTAIGDEVYAGDDLDPIASPRVHTGMVWLYRAEPSLPGVKPVKETNKINGNRLKVRAVDQESARPSSMHPGVVNVAMLGGSVSAMSEEIDYVVYQALLTPNTRASDVPDRTYVFKDADLAQ